MSIGATAGRYRIQGRIAVGGMGEVYLGSMSTFDGVEKAVALKVVRADLVADEELAHLFVEEAKVAMSLSHANIVQAFDVGRIDERWFLAMEHVDGMNLGTVLRACAKKLDQPIPQRFALYIAVEALKGLDYAHRRAGGDGRPLGIVHRDISPANILVSFEGEVKIADFGIAKSALRGSRRSSNQNVKGKVPYMAPEQLRGASVDRRADLYSMGAVLFEMLIGKRMLPGADDMALVPDVLAGRFLRPREISRDVPEALEQIVTRAVALEPDQRYPNAAAMRQDLESFAMTSGYLLSSNDVADFVRDVMRAEVPGTASSTAASAATERLVAAAVDAADSTGNTTRPSGKGRPVDEAASEPAGGGGGDPFDAILGVELEKVDSQEPFSVFTSRSIGIRREVTAPLVSEGGDVPSTRDVPRTRDVAKTPAAVVAHADDPEPTSTGGQRVAGLSPSRGPLIVVAAVLAALSLAFVGYRVLGEQASSNAGDVATPGPTVEHAPSHTAPDVQRPRTTPTADSLGSAATTVATTPATPAPTGADPTPRAAEPAGARPRGGHGHAGSTSHSRANDTTSTGAVQTTPVTPTTAAATPPPTPPTAAAATVSINTDPWTYVTIDGALVRSTPLLGYHLSSGRHRVQLRNPSEHIDRNLVLDLAPGENRRVSLDLHAAP